MTTAVLEPVVVSAPTPTRVTPKPAPKPSSMGAGIYLRVLFAFAALNVWAVVYALGLGAAQEARSQSVLYAQFREQLAAGTAPAGGAIRPGKPVALLDIPRLRIRDVVVEGTSPGELLSGPGHRVDTPLPGETGVSIFYGRGATFGAPFGRLTSLTAGDSIDVTDAVGTFHYVVQGVRRDGSLLPAPLPANGSRLTLGSATGDGWRAKLAPSKPFYIDAVLQGTALAEPGGRTSTLPASNNMLGSDGSALASLVRWLQLLCVVVVLSAWMRTRWGRWQTWLVAVPSIGAALWLVTETAFKLLPNVL